MIASLGMYDGGELTAANDALWEAIAQRLERFGMPDVPSRLTRGRPLAEVWSSERLLFGQTCGHPFAARYRGQLRLIATPQYSAPGCSDLEHRSFVIVHARNEAVDLAALRGSRAVINEVDSMTGRHLLGDAMASAGGSRDFFARVETSGSHAQSLARVAAREADVAAIDCVSHAHLMRAVPAFASETRILHRTRATPSLPFVISASYSEHDASLVRRALAEVFTDPVTEDARRTLRLAAVHVLPEAAYDVTLEVAANADRVLGSLP